MVDGTRLLLGVTERSVTVLHSHDVHAADVHATAPQATLVEATVPDAAPVAVAAVAAVAVEPAADFAHSLSAAVHAEPRSAEPVPMLRPRRDRGTGKRGSSILAPATWRQTGAALRQSR